MAWDASSSRPASEALRDFAARTRDFAARARDGAHLSQLDAAAAAAFAAFEAAAIDALLLKGPALARTLYEGAYRPYSDVDVLIAPDDADAARQALADLGYASVSDGLGIVDVGGGTDAETWAQARDREATGLMIDLHLRLPGVQASAPAAWDALAEHRAWIEVGGRRVPTLDAAGLALHVALHAAQHGPSYPGPIADLERGLEHWPQDVWSEASALGADVGAADVFAAGLRLVAAGRILADALGLPAAHAAAWAIEHRYERPRGTFHLDALADARTARERASIVRRSLLPGREWMRWQYPWAHRGAAGLVAAYGLHLARTPLWALRAWLFRRARRRARR